METEMLSTRRPSRLRADVPEPAAFDLQPYLGSILWTLVAASFVLIGGANLDLNADEAKIALSALEPVRPFGQVNGSWDPAVWAGSILPSKLWNSLSKLGATSAAVRWPAAIAALLIGFLISRPASKASASLAGILVGLAWFASLGLIDRSSTTGLDLILALGVVGALSRILTKGSDWVAGLWLAWAFLAGGWPPVALVALCTIVIGRKGSTLSFRLILPPLAMAIVWSGWCLSTAPPDLWGAAIALPLTRKPSWDFIPATLLIGLPWSPVAALALSKSVRDRFRPDSLALAKGWAQIAGACLVVGTIIPGLSLASRGPALAGLAVVAGLVLDALFKPEQKLSRPARNAARIGLGLIVGGWVVVVVPASGYLAFAVPYFRAVVILGACLAGLTAALAVAAFRSPSGLRLTATLLVLAVGLKLGHWGYYVPEWNYRQSQGPWGRAVGQFVPPLQPIYITHEWSPDFTYAIGRPVRRIAQPSLLKSQPGNLPKFILLHGEEFKHWPQRAPQLVKVADFLDEFGSERVLARTEGAMSWRATRVK